MSARTTRAYSRPLFHYPSMEEWRVNRPQRRLSGFAMARPDGADHMREGLSRRYLIAMGTKDATECRGCSVHGYDSPATNERPTIASISPGKHEEIRSIAPEMARRRRSNAYGRLESPTDRPA